MNTYNLCALVQNSTMTLNCIQWNVNTFDQLHFIVCTFNVLSQATACYPSSLPIPFKFQQYLPFSSFLEIIEFHTIFKIQRMLAIFSVLIEDALIYSFIWKILPFLKSNKKCVMWYIQWWHVALAYKWTLSIIYMKITIFYIWKLPYSIVNVYLHFSSH
jgi:hypothetical protein